jgi:uncharacterized protein (DUF58 family)
MQVGRRYWEVGAVGAFLALLAVVFERPLLGLGAVGVGAWLLTRQFVFLRDVSAMRSSLVAEQEVEPDVAFTDEAISVSLRVRLREPSPLVARLVSNPPVVTRGATQDERTVRLAPGETSDSTVYAVESAISGRYEIDSPTVEVTDPFGLLHEQFPHGTSQQFVVEPRSPRQIHVGEGGSRSTLLYGAHSGGEQGEGIDFAMLRQYVTGDPANRIDWKATARLGEAYVHEYEIESNRETVILFDHRGALAQGRRGERKLDYLRAVAIALVKSAQKYNDPLGIYAVGDDGTTERFSPSIRDEHYQEFQRVLQRLEPASTSEASGVRATHPFALHRSSDRLHGDDSAYATTLRPYFDVSDRDATDLADRPMLGTAKSMIAQLGDADWNVLFTDDTAKGEVLEAANLLRQGESRVTLFLAPSVFFEPGGLADLESAYSRYLEFEDFRRRLAGLDRVRAFEVAPGDRVEAVLRERRSDRRVTS